MTSGHWERGSVARIASSHPSGSREGVVVVSRVCLLLLLQLLRYYMLWWVMPWLRRRLLLHCEVERGRRRRTTNRFFRCFLGFVDRKVVVRRGQKSLGI